MPRTEEFPHDFSDELEDGEVPEPRLSESHAVKDEDGALDAMDARAFSNRGFVEQVTFVAGVWMKTAQRLSKRSSVSDDEFSLSAFMYRAFEVHVHGQQHLPMKMLYRLVRGELETMPDVVRKLHTSKRLPPRGAETPHLGHWHMLATYFNSDEAVGTVVYAYRGLLRVARNAALFAHVRDHPQASDEAAHKVALRVGRLTEEEYDVWQRRVVGMQDAERRNASIFQHKFMTTRDLLLEKVTGKMGGLSIDDKTKLGDVKPQLGGTRPQLRSKPYAGPVTHRAASQHVKPQCEMGEPKSQATAVKPTAQGGYKGNVVSDSTDAKTLCEMLVIVKNMVERGQSKELVVSTLSNACDHAKQLNVTRN